MKRLLLVLALIAAPCAAQTLVNSAKFDCGNSASCVFNTIPAVTGGSAVSIGGFVQSSGSATHTTISGCSATWSTAFSFTAFDGNREVFLFTAPNVGAGCTSVTLTFPASAGAGVIEAEYSGMPTTALLDVASAAMTTGTGTCTSAAITPTAGQAELYIGILLEKTNQSQTWTGTNSWVVEQNLGEAFDGSTVALADKNVASTSGSYTVSATVTPGTNSACAFATFKASAAAPTVNAAVGGNAKMGGNAQAK